MSVLGEVSLGVESLSRVFDAPESVSSTPLESHVLFMVAPPRSRDSTTRAARARLVCTDVFPSSFNEELALSDSSRSSPSRSTNHRDISRIKCALGLERNRVCDGGASSRCFPCSSSFADPATRHACQVFCSTPRESHYSLSPSRPPRSIPPADLVSDAERSPSSHPLPHVSILQSVDAC